MSLSSSIDENEEPFRNDGDVEIDNDYSFIRINTDILQLYNGQTGEVKSEFKVYEYENNYYVIFTHRSIKENESGFIAFDDRFNIIRDAETLPGYKIDYSKLVHMTDIESIEFVTAGNQTDLDLSSATHIDSISNISPHSQSKAQSPSVSPESMSSNDSDNQGQQQEQQEQEQQEQEQEQEIQYKTPKPTVKFSLEKEEDETQDDQDAQDDQDVSEEVSFDDFLNGLMTGEVTETRQVSGLERRTFEINPNEIKNLLTLTGNEFIDNINGRYLINMQKISEAYTSGISSSLGKLFLTVKGMPKWIKPVVNGKFVPNSTAYSSLNQPSFQISVSEDAQGCSFPLDNVLHPLYTGYSMDSDKPLDLPGSSRKARADFTINAVANTGKADGKNIKIPGIVYKSTIKLTAEAQSRLDTKTSKSDSMYVRLLTLPRSIKGIDIEAQQATNTVHITGFKVTNGYTLHSEFQDLNFIPVNCGNDFSQEDYIGRKLSEIIPTIDDVIDKARPNSNLASYLKLLKLYGYDRNDLTLNSYLRMGLKISKKLSPVLDNWAATHYNEISAFTRINKIKEHALRAADNGKYKTYEKLVSYLLDVQYLRCAFNEKESLKALNKLTPFKKPARSDSILNENGTLLFKDDITGLYYTAEHYNMLNEHRLQVKMSNALSLGTATLQSERENSNLDTMKLALETLENHQREATRGILDNLKNVLTGDNLKSSAIFDMLTSFDMRDIIGQIKFIKHLDLFVDSKIVRLNSEMQYFIASTKEQICCKHIVDELKNLPIDEYSIHGNCKYCGATIENEEHSDDYGQIQFMTTRDMFAHGEDSSIMQADPSEATLKHFLKHAMSIIVTIMDFKLSPTDIAEIIEATIKYIKEKNPLSKEPYGSFASTIPAEKVTKDLRMVLLHNKQLDDENSQGLFIIKGKSATLTPAFGIILNYFTENSLDATSLNENEVFAAMRAADKKIKGDREGVDVLTGVQTEPIKTLGQKHIVFNYMYNIVVLNKHAYNLACLMAHVNLSVNVIYKNTTSIENLISSENIYTICNSYHPYMRSIMDEHVSNLLKSDQKKQQMIDHFTRYSNLFIAPFSKTLYDLKLTSSVSVEEKTGQHFLKIYESLVRHNSALYENFSQSQSAQSDLKAQYNFVNVIPETSYDQEITSVSDYMECWAAGQFKAQEYGVELLKHYDAVNDGIDTVDYIQLMPGDVKPVRLMSMFNDVQELSENSASVSELTFRAALSSSVILFNRPFETGDDPIGENYNENERVLSAHAPKFDFAKIDDEFCGFNVSAPLRNPSLQTNLTYSQCVQFNLHDEQDKIKTIDRQLIDNDLSVREQFLTAQFKDNFIKLIQYKNMEGYTNILNGLFDDRRNSAKWLKNAISKEAVDSILVNDHQKLLDDRQYVSALTESLKALTLDDELESRLKEDKVKTKQEQITLRKIFRTQKNGKTLRTLIQWLTKPLSEEALKEMEATAEQSAKSDLSGSTKYVIDKELASMEGYVLIDLIKIKGALLTFQEDMHLIDYKPVLPEIYNISYYEYLKVLELFKIPDQNTIAHFHAVLYSAIRLDIIMHVQKLINWQFKDEDEDQGIVLTEDNIRLSNEQIDLTPVQSKFVETLNLILEALSKITLDANVKSFTELYEARTRKYMEKSKTIRQNKVTGYEDAAQEEISAGNVVDENQIAEEAEEGLEDTGIIDPENDEDDMDDTEEGFGNTIGGEVDD